MRSAFKQIGLCACLFWFIVQIIGILIGCVMFLDSYDEIREGLIDDYSDSVQNWEADDKNFSNLQIKVFNRYGYSDALHLEQQLSPKQDDEGELPEYISQFFTLTFSPQIFQVPDEDYYDSEYNVNLSLQITDDAQEFKINLPELPLFNTTYTVGSNEYFCSQQEGEYIGNQCKFYQKLTGFCVQIFKKDAIWQISDNELKLGCEGPELRYGIYQQISAKSPVKAEFNHFITKVYSSEDPYITGAKLTQGSFEFGHSSTYLFYASIFLIITCSILIIQPILYIRKHCKLGYVPPFNRGYELNKQDEDL